MVGGFRLDSTTGKFIVTDNGFGVHKDCCCEKTSPGYKLEQCDVRCNTTDCDGDESDIYTTPALSSLDDTYIDQVIFYDNKCWKVTALGEAPESPEALSPQAPYTKYGIGDDGCHECCEGSYPCAECTDPDSVIITVDGTGCGSIQTPGQPVDKEPACAHIPGECVFYNFSETTQTCTYEWRRWIWEAGDYGVKYCRVLLFFNKSSCIWTTGNGSIDALFDDNPPSGVFGYGVSYSPLPTVDVTVVNDKLVGSITGIQPVGCTTCTANIYF